MASAVPASRTEQIRAIESQYPREVVALMKRLGKPIARLPDATGRLESPPGINGRIFTDLKGHQIVRHADSGIPGIAGQILGEDGVIRRFHLYRNFKKWKLATQEGDNPPEADPYETHRVSLCERFQRHGEERDEIFLERLLRGQVPQKDPWSILQINPCYIVSAFTWWYGIPRP